jgi:hypothetical protein
VIVVALSLALAVAEPASSSRGFTARTSRLSPRLKQRMTGNSWHRGCPVPLRDLRLIRLSFHGFDRKRHVGKVVAHEDAVGTLVRAFRAMYRNRFRIHRMHLIDRYGGSDEHSMRHDNTSAFNCRKVEGSSSWSEHAYGRAIDINPIENPFVGSDGTVDPPEGRPYTDRSQDAPGLIHTGGGTVTAFGEEGWGWGGYWSSDKDYQHFSASGR